MKIFTSNNIERFFFIFYVLYPFYLYWLLNFDDGKIHYTTFTDFFFGLIPSLISWSLTFIYLILKRKNVVILALILTVTAVYHLIVIYSLYTLFEIQAQIDIYFVQKIISYSGIALTSLLFLSKVFRSSIK